jgi:hypothetical protein
VSEHELDLLSTFYRMYSEVPVDLSQEIHIDPFGKVFWRKYTKGPLAGFFACTTLAGNQAVAVYKAGEAQVAAMADEDIAVPLPPGTGSVTVACIGADGAVTAAPHARLGDEVLLGIQRCCGDVSHYRIEWEG